MAALPEIDAFTHDHVFLGAAHDDNAAGPCGSWRLPPG